LNDAKHLPTRLTNPRPQPLTRIVEWSQKLACEVLRPGDLAVDLTAGKGRDTLALMRAVGRTGQVVSFDTQAAALEQTRALLEPLGDVVNTWSEGQGLSAGPGVTLVHACHSTLGRLLQRPARAIMANLGYLPGGDRTLVTHPETTLAALQQSIDLLAEGGRLAVTVYPAHPGGACEAQRVDDFFRVLPQKSWQVLSLRTANCDRAPRLLVAERLS